MLSELIEQETPGPSADKSDALLPVRWQLNRGGIVNVYQYGNEVLDFGGGRLLLRGANGAGKTTAMNMLLPFLLDTRLWSLDASGEQTGTQILNGWMLDGHDDPQRVGYLWVEFHRGDKYFVCGCGLKASRSAGTVNQWWFATSQRPGLGFSLVEDRVPLGKRQLGEVLGAGQVFDKRRRRDYRREVEKRLFGGVPIGQHVRLVNRVRNPRIGDRIDEDIPQLLKGALPRLSDRILTDVGGALDELAEHQREVVELESTAGELEGLLGVYRSYCFSWVGTTTDRGRQHLRTIRRVEREREQHRRTAHAAKRQVEQLDRRVAGLEEDTERLVSSITDLKSSPAYRSVKELESQRNLVNTQLGRVADKQAMVDTAGNRLRGDTEQLEDREADTDRNRARINHLFDDVAGTARRRGVGGTPPGPIGPDTAASAINRTGGQIDRFETILRRRHDHVGEVENQLGKVEALGDTQRRAEDMWKAARDRSAAAERTLQEATEQFAGAVRDWSARAQQWASSVVSVAEDAHRALTDPADGQLSVSTRAEAETIRERLEAGVEEVTAHQRQLLARAERELADAQRAENEARSAADRWASLTEPDLPFAAWQTPGGRCVADLVDFSPSLSDRDRAGLEAAMQASGVLSARPEDRAVVLADGDLVAVSSTPATEPLSRFLTVRRKPDTAAMAAVLEGVSTDPSDSEASVVVSTDGTFRVGSLRGRHSKDYPEFIGEAARLATLERGRNEANRRLEQATAETATAENLANRHGVHARRLADLQKTLPDLTGVVEADTRLGTARTAADRDEAILSEQADELEAAEHALQAAQDRLHTLAKERVLPSERNALDRVRDDLDSAERNLGECRRLLGDLETSTRLRDRAARNRDESETALAKARDELALQQKELRSQEESLQVLTSSIGQDENVIIEQLHQHQKELETKKAKLVRSKNEHIEAVDRRARADTAAKTSDSEWERLNTENEARARHILEGLSTPGFWAALTDRPYPADRLALPADLQTLLSTLAEHLPAYTGKATNRDSVYQSERQRRGRLGGGWDIEVRSPDNDSLPLSVEVTGPSGRRNLPDAATAVRQKHEKDSRILAEDQKRQLRDLLQGETAKEVAEKSRAAKYLIDAMREHIRELSTASRIGVDIRWRIDPDLDADTARMAQLLSTLPDLRTDRDKNTLIGLVGDHLERTREDDPERGYKQALSEALDYKKWHQLQVLYKRGQQTKVLRRRNDLSEGEKKFVTYLPMFAAVAASCDSISDAAEDAGTARFVLLDDAFAKVSEDNHAQLFGLLTALDLDWIATSERLWGDHATIPELEIAEVVRDDTERTIILERCRWDGHSRTFTDPYG